MQEGLPTSFIGQRPLPDSDIPSSPVLRTSRAERRMGRLFKTSASNQNQTSTNGSTVGNTTLTKPTSQQQQQPPTFDNLPTFHVRSVSSVSVTMSHSAHSSGSISNGLGGYVNGASSSLTTTPSSATNISSPSSSSSTSVQSFPKGPAPQSSLPHVPIATQCSNRQVSPGLRSGFSKQQSFSAASMLTNLTHSSLLPQHRKPQQQLPPQQQQQQQQQPVQQPQPPSQRSGSISAHSHTRSHQRKASASHQAPNHHHHHRTTSRSVATAPKASILAIAIKFRFIYKECIQLIRRLNLDKTITLQVGTYPKFVALLDAAERHAKTQSPSGSHSSTSQRQASIKSGSVRGMCPERLVVPLTVAMLTSMKDLVTLIDSLSISCRSFKSVDPETLRMSYFTLYSLFVEVINMCRILSPQVKILRRRSHSVRSLASSSSSSISSQSAAALQDNPFAALARSSSKSLVQTYRKKKAQKKALLSQGKPIIPHQTITTTSGGSPSSGKSSIPRPLLKIDTTIRRQDSNLSQTSTHSDVLGSSAKSSGTSMVSSVDDDKLYELIVHAIQGAQVVFSQLNAAISKSAITTAKKSEHTVGNGPTKKSGPAQLDHVAQKIKGMTMKCVASMEQTKRIKTAISVSIRSDKLDADGQKKLYEETNTFLKSIISLLAATKGAIQDIPALNEVRGALSNLTRTTKELTICLEKSALKQAVVSNSSASATLMEQPLLSSIPSVSNFQHMGSQQPHSAVKTPLSSRSIGSIKSRIEMKDTVSMKQHILDLKSATIHERSPMPTPITTPLVASIGPAAASAVLPTSSNPASATVSNHDMERNPFEKQLGPSS